MIPLKTRIAEKYLMEMLLASLINKIWTTKYTTSSPYPQFGKILYFKTFFDNTGPANENNFLCIKSFDHFIEMKTRNFQYDTRFFPIRSTFSNIYN